MQTSCAMIGAQTPTKWLDIKVDITASLQSNKFAATLALPNRAYSRAHSKNYLPASIANEITFFAP